MKAELRRRESLSVLPSDLLTDDKQPALSEKEVRRKRKKERYQQMFQ